MRRPSPWIIPAEPFTAEDVRRLGVTRGMLRVALANGTIHRIRRGVFAAQLPASAKDDHLHRALAEQVRHPSWVASHGTAALSLGIPLVDADAVARGPLQFTRHLSPNVRSQRGTRLQLHIRTLPSGHIAGGPESLVVTTGERTACDLARGLALPEALVALDHVANQNLRTLTRQVASSDHASEGKDQGRALRHAYQDPKAVEAALAPLLATGQQVARARGHGTLLPTLARIDPRRESPLESISGGHILLSDLPEPVWQLRIPTVSGTFYSDAGWPGHGVLGEADGLRKYTEPLTLRREKVRQEHLERAGWQVVRWTWQEITQAPDDVIARLWAALRRGGWNGPVRP